MESSSIRLKIEASKFLCRCTILSNDLVQLLSVIAEVLLFGIFCVLYPISVWILVRRQHRGRRSKTATLWLTAIVTTMFLCVCTVRLSC